MAGMGMGGTWWWVKVVRFKPTFYGNDGRRLLLVFVLQSIL
jgi:hypothetical protein